MSASKLFLWISTAIWLPYGVFCFFRPDFLTEAAGIVLSTETATTEVRAMYGGLEAAIGCLALSAAIDSTRVESTLRTLGFLTAGLAVTRLGGIFLDGGLSAYTGGALVLEVTLTLSALVLSRQTSSSPRPA